MIIKKSTLSTMEAQYLQQYDYLALQQFYLSPYTATPDMACATPFGP